MNTTSTVSFTQFETEKKIQLMNDFNYLCSIIDETTKKFVDGICKYREKQKLPHEPLVDLSARKYSKDRFNGKYTFHDKFVIELPLGDFEMPDREWSILMDYIWFKNNGF